LKPHLAKKVIAMSKNPKTENFFKYLRALVCVVDNNDIAMNQTLMTNRRVSGSSTLFHPPNDPRYETTDVTQVVPTRQLQSNMLCMRMTTMYGGDPGYFNNAQHFLMMLRTLRGNQGSYLPMNTFTSSGPNVSLFQNPMLRAVPRSAVNVVTNNLKAYAQKLSIGNKVALSANSNLLVNKHKKSLETSHQKLVEATKEVIRQYEDIALAKHFRNQYDVANMNDRQKQQFRALMEKSKQKLPNAINNYHGVSDRYNSTMTRCLGMVSFLKNLCDGGINEATVHQYNTDGIYV
jgi:succinate dehydrogenase flavin-adding protein (antitoxin of CptAB toxin-antitoxin module)